MNARTLIAGIVGGIVLFAWGSIAHVATPLGHVGYSAIPNEGAVMEAMRANINQDGLYFFPWLDPARQSDEAAMKEWGDKAVRGPTGIMVYRMQGDAGIPPAMLAVEFTSNVFVGILAALVLANISGTLLMRALLTGLMGLMASADIFVSYWNWYKFPADYTLAQSAIQVIGFLLMGATIAAIAKKP